MISRWSWGVVTRSAVWCCGALVGSFLLPISANACACCADEGFRYVTSRTASEYEQEIVTSVRFARAAKLFVSEAGLEEISGIDRPSESYFVTAEWTGKKLALRFRTTNGAGGTISLAMPRKISIFVIDPRDDRSPQTGSGVTLYKEWKLTSPLAATGSFEPSVRRDQQVTLILQGRGNGCDSVEDFTHWSLVVHGPKGEFTVFGTLQSGEP